MTDLKERVARLICEVEGRNPDDCTFGHGWATGDGSGYECLRRFWQDRTSAADAAIALIVEECAEIADANAHDECDVAEQIASAIRALAKEDKV